MADEIERKFLVTGADWRSEAVKKSQIRQGYIAVNERCAVRIRIADSEALLNIKSSGLAIARKEYEYSIPMNDAVEMMQQFCAKQHVQKTRYYVHHQDRVWEIDVFEGLNAGLVIAEVELETETDHVDLPSWVGEEVSGEAKYLNSNLALKPFQSWQR